jgi:D-serine deaminase-like pyridoxal phosphate-dependent protein
MVSAISDLRTPCLLLDEEKLLANTRSMQNRARNLGVNLRPHLKTAKNIDVALRAMTHPSGPAIVSTLAEAEYFASHGVTDLTYGVGIAPQKLDRVGAIIRGHGADLKLILDSIEQAQAVSGWSRAKGLRLPALIEIDADGHRAGVAPDHADLLIAIAKALHDDGAELRGVLTHAGDSYHLSDTASLRAAAARERDAVVTAALILRSAGFACPIVSVGSTPTATHAANLAGVTEMRPGVYMFGDLVQAGIGACAIGDIAVSVLAAVIGHQRAKGWIIVDAGWMALSRDRGTSSQAVDQGYGVVCDLQGQPYPDLIVTDANQEHGIVSVRPGSSAPLPDLRLGAMVRILPNHACATGAQHDAYHVIDGNGAVFAEWTRIRGW